MKMREMGYTEVNSYACLQTEVIYAISFNFNMEQLMLLIESANKIK